MIIDLGAIFFGYLGYKLFVKGIDSGPTRAEFKSKLANVMVTGRGPGLAFMTLGAVILIVSLLHGGSQTEWEANKASAGNNVTGSLDKFNREVGKPVEHLPAAALDGLMGASTLAASSASAASPAATASDSGGGGGGGGGMIGNQRRMVMEKNKLP